MLHKMDAEKNRVKQSKSTTQIEKRAQAYQAAVEQFDMSTNTVGSESSNKSKKKISHESSAFFIRKFWKSRNSLLDAHILL